MRISNCLVTGIDLKRSVDEGWMIRVNGSADIPDNTCVTKAVASAFVQLDTFRNQEPSTMPMWSELIPLPVLPENAAVGLGMGYYPQTPGTGQLLVNAHLGLRTAFATQQTFVATIHFKLYTNPTTFEYQQFNVDVTVTAPAGVTDLGYFIVYQGPLEGYYGITTDGNPYTTKPRVIDGYRMEGDFSNP